MSDNQYMTLAQARQALGVSAFVYVIGFAEYDDIVKIGVARNPHRRLRAIQTANPEEMCIKGQFRVVDWDRARVIEKATHGYFDGEHVRGEWYAVAPVEAISYIQDTFSRDIV